MNEGESYFSALKESLNSIPNEQKFDDNQMSHKDITTSIEIDKIDQF